MWSLPATDVLLRLTFQAAVALHHDLGAYLQAGVEGSARVVAWCAHAEEQSEGRVREGLGRAVMMENQNILCMQ